MWEDIIMRIRPSWGVRDRSVQVDTRNLNVRVFIKREPFAIMSWGGRQGKTQDGIRAKFNARIAPANLNSSRGMTPGLIDPNGPDTPANRIPLPNPNKTIGDQTQDDQVTAPATAHQDADVDHVGQLLLRNLIEGQAQEEQATAHEDAIADDEDAESDTEVGSRPRSEIEIAADRLLIIAIKGPRVLEPGASDNFEDYSSTSSSEDEAID